jgi:hypothetical protein
MDEDFFVQPNCFRPLKVELAVGSVLATLQDHQILGSD